MHTQELQSDAIALNDLFTVEELVAQNPKVLSINTMRWHLRHRDHNGLASACVNMRRKLLISKSRFERWLATQTDAARAAA